MEFTGKQSFHSEGNFLPKGYFGIWKEKNEEMRFGRKLEGNSTILKEKGRKSYNLNSFQ